MAGGFFEFLITFERFEYCSVYVESISMQGTRGEQVTFWRRDMRVRGGRELRLY